MLNSLMFSKREAKITGLQGSFTKFVIISIVKVLATYFYPKHFYFKIAFFLILGFYGDLYASACSGDSIGRLETRLINGIYHTKNQLHNLATEQEQIQAQLVDKQLTKKQKAALDKSLRLSKAKAANFVKIEQAYLMLLSDSRKLIYMNDQVAQNSLKRIHKALYSLEKSKIPSGSEFNVLKNNEIPHASSRVYDFKLESPCQLTQNEEGTIWANQYTSFFEYTDPRISSYFKDHDFLECYARFIESKKKYYLELKFVLNSPKASQIYGSIDPSNPARLDFLNGDFIYLETFALNTSELEAGTGNTLVTIQYKLDKEDLNYLSKNEVDAFTIIWTNGADRFEIIYLDVLKNMLECLKKRS